MSGLSVFYSCYCCYWMPLEYPLGHLWPVRQTEQKKKSQKESKFDNQRQQKHREKIEQEREGGRWSRWYQAKSKDICYGSVRNSLETWWKCLRTRRVQHTTSIDHKRRPWMLEKILRNKSSAQELVCIYVDVRPASLILSVNICKVLTLGKNNNSYTMMKVLTA